jgi:GLPGLI family protein
MIALNNFKIFMLSKLILFGQHINLINMGKKIFSLILLISINFYSQKSNELEIIYGKISSVNLDSINNSNIPSSTKEILTKMLNSVGKVEYKLIINNNKAKFEYLDFLKDDNFDKKAINLGGGNTVFYDFKKNKIFRSDYLNRGNLIILNQDSLTWNILTDKKEISGYTCYKAIGYKKVYKLRTGEKVTHEYEAWFCPEFATICGPGEFYGLPGLIFEANEKNAKIKFYLKKIQFKEVKTQIEIPNKSILTEEEEFLQAKGLYKKSIEE